MNRTVLLRVVGEGALIVVSILLALSADAWLDSRNQATQMRGHMAVLVRDFNTMSERVDASHSAAQRGVDSGRQLSTVMQKGSEIDPGLARELFWYLVFYEVFTPSIAAYEALVSSG